MIITSIVCYKIDSALFDSFVDMTDDLKYVGFAMGGLFVGIGSRICEGCEQGHAFCGIPLLNLRSLTCFAVFLGFGFLASNLKYNNFYLQTNEDYSYMFEHYDYELGQTIVLTCCIILLIASLIYHKCKYKGNSKLDEAIIAFFVGCTYTVGLIVSGLCSRTKVTGFLTFNSNWNCSIGLTFTIVIVLDMALFQLIRKMGRPVWREYFNEFSKTKVDGKSLGGAALFGIGWGVAALDCGSGYVLAALIIPQISLLFFLCMILGNIFIDFVEFLKSC